jgi:hypothetical protein
MAVAVLSALIVANIASGKIKRRVDGCVRKPRTGSIRAAKVAMTGNHAPVDVPLEMGKVAPMAINVLAGNAMGMASRASANLATGSHLTGTVVVRALRRDLIQSRAMVGGRVVAANQVVADLAAADRVMAGLVVDDLAAEDRAVAVRARKTDPGMGVICV